MEVKSEQAQQMTSHVINTMTHSNRKEKIKDLGCFQALYNHT